MRLFGLTPDDVLARIGPQPPSRTPTLGTSMAYGAAAFGAVSVAAFAIWALKWVGRTGPMYAAIAAVYLALCGLALSRLVIGPGATRRFAALFAAAFSLYAAAWCAGWFGIGGKLHGDLWGSAVGLAVMTLLVQRAFGRRDDFLPAWAVLFALHTLGYYLGGALHAKIPGVAGQLLWGAAYGSGFGGGLGCVIFRSQEPVRIRLPSAS